MPTGDLCPMCKEGHLYPEGRRNILYEDKLTGEQSEYTQLRCDKCGITKHEQTLAQHVLIKDSEDAQVKRS